jgi:hypothetical protein
MNSRHSEIRSQQRCIPRFVDDLLEAYGQETYDGHGGLIRYFDKRSLRQMERDMGREPVRMFSCWHDAYKVVSVSDGGLITIGHRYRRIIRQ